MVKQLKIRRKMSKEKAPDGRIYMDYVIYRLEQIEKEEVSDELKLNNLSFLIEEFRAKKHRDGEDRTLAPIY